MVKKSKKAEPFCYSLAFGPAHGFVRFQETHATKAAAVKRALAFAVELGQPIHVIRQNLSGTAGTLLSTHKPPRTKKR